MSTHLPTGADGITAGWMRKALGAGSDGGPPAVARVDVEALGADFNAFGSLQRCRLYLADGSQASPASVVVKMPGAGAATSWFAGKLSLYEREYTFYRHLADHAPVRVPAFHFGRLDARTNRFVLVLEDLEGWGRSAGDRLLGDVEVRLTVRTIARLHGCFWNAVRDPRLRRCTTVLPPDYGWMLRSLYWYGLASARERFGDVMPAEVVGWAETLGSGLTDHLADAAAGPRTFVHGDLRGANLFFTAGGNPELALIDWQGCGIGNGLTDLAYFMVFSVSTPVRRRLEDEMLEEYHAGIVAGGASDVTLRQCRNGYRRSLFTAFMVCLLGCGMTPADARIRADLRHLIERALAAIDDLDATEFLPGRRARRVPDRLHAALTKCGYTAYRGLGRLFRRSG